MGIGTFWWPIVLGLILVRRIAPTPEGARHPLLEGRPAAFDAPAVHGDEVEALPPEGATRHAGNAASPVQAENEPRRPLRRTGRVPAKRGRAYSTIASSSCT